MTHELVDDGTVIFKKILTTEIVANELIKSLGIFKFREFVSIFGLVDFYDILLLGS